MKKPFADISATLLVCFAAERTLLSWIRTALALMALGFAVDRFGLILSQAMPEKGAMIIPRLYSLWSGVVMVVLGCIMAITAAVRYLRFYYKEIGRDLESDVPAGLISGSVFSLIVAVLGSVVALFILSAFV